MTVTAGETTKVYFDSNGDRMVVESGGEIRIESGGKFTVAGTQGNLTTSSLTDSTGGTPSTTLAAITAGGSYAQADLTAIKNAIAQLALSINNIITALRNAGISA